MKTARVPWWELDRKDPTVARWLSSDGARFPWCYELIDTTHLLQIKRDENHDPIWFGTWCGERESSYMGRTVCRNVPTCEACIIAYEKEFPHVRPA